MTGFAAVSREDEGDRVHVTIKSVNHRFLDTQVKAPQILGAIETMPITTTGQPATDAR
jgi:uncharacterized protein YicC (UPF0701 family)